ncbi:hypothetical protein BJF85_16665 [Saccharomonospora sp. CUA-673]|nr:hypothetical protein BJF85_16665 [Saccharomonospora sp. CUA-673]
MLQHSARCRSCNGRIVWARTADGERMPVDDTPARGGNVLLMLQGVQLVAGVLGKADATRRRAGGIELYVPHFATCPNADRHRRR